MKHNYLAPEAEQLKMTLAHTICTSPSQQPIDTDPTIDLF